MENDTESIQQQIQTLEQEMIHPDFWSNKSKAQETLKKLNELKNELQGSLVYDKGNAIISILSGAGGDDAEDFSSKLLTMYVKYCEKKSWKVNLIHENKNNLGGYRNVSVEVIGKNAYGTLKHESGVHRLVRISPFNAKKLRHTSFSLVEVIPKLDKNADAIILAPDDIKIEFSKSGGPGGQNVNKRETAVRITHLATGLTVHVTTERSQEQNKERALEMLKGKLFKKRQEDDDRLKRGLSISTTTDIEWGSQIRSYVLHPYKMVKDHRTDTEVRDVDSVLDDGDIDVFIESEKNL